MIIKDRSGNEIYEIKGCFREGMREIKDFRNLDLSHCDFSVLPLSEICFDDADLTGCCFHGTQLVRASFRRCILKDTDFSTAKMDGARFEGSEISKCLWGFGIPDLQGAYFMGYILEMRHGASITYFDKNISTK